MIEQKFNQSDVVTSKDSIKHYHLHQGVTEVYISFDAKEKAILVYPLWNTFYVKTQILTIAYLMWNKERGYFVATQNLRQDDERVVRWPLIIDEREPLMSVLLND